MVLRHLDAYDPATTDLGADAEVVTANPGTGIEAVLAVGRQIHLVGERGAEIRDVVDRDLV